MGDTTNSTNSAIINDYYLGKLIVKNGTGEVTLGGMKIMNIADGIADADAVNFKQLATIGSELDTKITNTQSDLTALNTTVTALQGTGNGSVGSVDARVTALENSINTKIAVLTTTLDSLNSLLFGGQCVSITDTDKSVTYVNPYPDPVPEPL